MGTVITIEIVHGDSAPAEADAAVDRAFAWFAHIESCCSRFDPESDVMRLARSAGEPMAVSAPVLEAVKFAVAVAEESGGAFDPTVGATLETRGINRDYRTGRDTRSGVADDSHASYRDVRIDPEAGTITLLKPLVLDLGAVANGLAVDMAARELAPFRDFAIDAGGDLYLAGLNAAGQPWHVGIRHPRADNVILDALRVSDRAVCTSGDYERSGTSGEPHIVDARARGAAPAAASVTTVAPTALLADAAATAAFALGPVEGIAFLERLGVDGVMISSTLERFATRGFPGESAPPVL
jgi:thiamine biosynthesis lipoprotein